MMILLVKVLTTMALLAASAAFVAKAAGFAKSRLANHCPLG